MFLSSAYRPLPTGIILVCTVSIKSFFTCASAKFKQSFLNYQQIIILIFIFYELQLLAGSLKWQNIRDFNTHFLNSSFLFSKIFFFFEDLSMATQDKKVRYRTKYSNNLNKLFSFVSKCSLSISDTSTSFIATFVTWTSLVLLAVLTMLKNMLIYQTTKKKLNSPLNVSILPRLWSLKSSPTNYFYNFLTFSKYQWKVKLRK